MKQSALFTILMSAGMCFLLLFQNCSQLESKRAPELSFAQETESNTGDSNPPPIMPPVTVPPVVADFGPRFMLDNYLLNAALSFDILNGDLLKYETDYRSTLMLTLVTVQSAAGQTIMSVSSDDCTNSKTLTFAEYDALFIAIVNANNDMMSTTPRVLIAGETVMPDCAFPHVGLDGLGAKADYELYLGAPRECVPENRFYNNSAGADAVNNLMNGHIDAICSM